MATQPNSFSLSTLKTFPEAFAELKRQGILTPIVTLEQLKAGLTSDQQQVVEKILNLDPKEYGVTTPYAGDLEPVPEELMVVGGQQFIENGVIHILGDKYVPRHVYAAYERMNDTFQHDNPGRALLIESAYRSPAYQVTVFINWCLSAYGGDIGKTVRHASPPNYSQHTIASKVALDLMDIDNSVDAEHLESFKKTVEYTWLRQHAGEFGFFESWQEGNEFGMKAEPWHWQYLGTKSET